MDNYVYTGKKAVNIRSGKIGVILRVMDNGSIQVLESICPYVLCTHDNWKTLELIDND